MNVAISEVIGSGVRERAAVGAIRRWFNWIGGAIKGVINVLKIKIKSKAKFFNK